MTRGPEARALIMTVLSQVEPYFSERVRIEVVAHRRWLTISHSHYQPKQPGPEDLPTPGEDVLTGSGATFISGLGTWIPFLPQGLRRRLLAQEVVETLLATGTTIGQDPEPDYHVVTRTTANGVMVEFDRPGFSGERVEIGPISNELLR